MKIADEDLRTVLCLSMSEGRQKYDAACKNILLNTRILAKILLGTVEELQGCSVEQVMELLIGVRAGVYSSPLHHESVSGDDENASEDGESFSRDDEGVTPLDTASKREKEGCLFFDIRIDMKSPDEKFGDIFIIDLEIQLGHATHLMNRAEAYVDRLVDEQLPKAAAKYRYANIKHAFSIWLCLDPKGGLKNRNKRYSRTERDFDGLLGHYLKPEKIEISNIIFLGLAGPEFDNFQGVIKMLYMLLSGKYSEEEVLDILHREFGIELTHDFRQKVQDMFKFSQYLERKSEKKGKAETMSKLKAIKAKITAGMSVDEAIELFNIPDDERPDYKEILSYPK